MTSTPSGTPNTSYGPGRLRPSGSPASRPAAGEKIPSKGGPGITRSDLLVINKIDLAPYVGASLAVMERDARRMRGTRPFVFSNLRAGEGVAEIARFIEDKGGLGGSKSKAND